MIVGTGKLETCMAGQEPETQAGFLYCYLRQNSCFIGKPQVWVLEVQQ